MSIRLRIHQLGQEFEEHLGNRGPTTKIVHFDRHELTRHTVEILLDKAELVSSKTIVDGKPSVIFAYYKRYSKTRSL